MIVNAKNPRWTDSSKTKVILDVELDDTVGEVPFVASPDDSTAYGPMLYNFALNGIFGDIAACEEERILAGELPLPEGYSIVEGKLFNNEQQANEVRRMVRETLAGLTAPEAIAKAELDEKYAAERKEKMRLLLAVEQQEGFPHDVDWSGIL
jgi:hypothetical protein